MLGMLPSPSVPYCGPASVISWNARALFCLDPVRTNRKLDYLCRLAAAADVVVIQEAHSNQEKATILDARLHESHDTFWYNYDDDSTIRGLGFVVKRSFLQRFDTYFYCGVLPGRAALLSLRGPEGGLDILGLHLDPYAFQCKILVKILKQ